MTDLSVLTFILLIKKNSHSSVLYLGMINTFHVPNPIMLNLFSIPAWGRKCIFDLFFSTLLSALLCDFCAFPNFRHFTCTSFSIFLKKKREREKES